MAVLLGSHLIASALLAGTYAVASAELFYTPTQRYGRFEARVQFAPADGVVSSFFLWKPDSEMTDVYWNEIDIEKIHECSYSSNVFWGMPESQMPMELEVEGELCSAYHTHAIEWTPDAIVWFLDGEEVRRLEGGEIVQGFVDNALPGVQIRFNVWPGTLDFGGDFDPASLPVHQYINWVAYYEYTPEAGPEGSDFTLSWREDFDGSALPADWGTGTWESPLGQSQHSSQNVSVVDGIAVLSLTADDALGFDGTPPEDPGESGGGTTDGGDGTGGGDSDDGSTTGGASSADAGTSGGSSVDTGSMDPGGDTSAATTGGATTAADDGSETGASGDPGPDTTPSDDGGGEDGCSCRTAPGRFDPSAALAWLGVLFGLRLGGRRRSGRSEHGGGAT